MEHRRVQDQLKNKLRVITTQIRNPIFTDIKNNRQIIKLTNNAFSEDS